MGFEWILWWILVIFGLFRMVEMQCLCFVGRESSRSIFWVILGIFEVGDENFGVEIGGRNFGSEVWIEPIPAIFDA